MREDQGRWRGRIVSDRSILAGKPVVKGTLIAVDLVLEELSHNPDIGEVLAAYPDLNRDDVRGCVSYARATIVAGERIRSLNSRKPAVRAGAFSKITKPNSSRSWRPVRLRVTLTYRKPCAYQCNSAD